MDVTTIPVPTTEAGIGTLRVPIPADDPLLAEALVASASIISDFEDQYLNELTDAVEQSLRSIRQMVIGRLRARATIVTPIAASAIVAAGNPWHDEVGRFAPKGYVKRVKLLGDRQDHRSGLNGIADIDFRYQPDPDQRAVMMWQHEFPMQRAVKYIARNMLEGKEDPFDGVPIPDGLVERWTQRHPRSNDDDPNWPYTEEDLRNDMLAAAEWAVMQQTRTMPKLYRGLMVDETKLAEFAAGRDIPLDFVSASPDKAEAAMYSSPFGSKPRVTGTDPVRVMLTIKNAEAVDLAPYVVGRMHGSREQLVIGRGRIVDRFKDEHGIWQVTIETAEEQALAASIGPDDYEILEILDQPFHIYDEYGAVVASGATFANPWHDEIGRFAPKGTGVKRLGPKTLNDNPTTYEQVNLLDQEAVKRSLEAYADTVTERINEMRPDEGLELALADIEATGPPDNEYMATFLLQDETGDIVAHMDRHIEFEKASAYAAGLQVDDDLQGHGIGTVLQESFEDWAASQDLAAMKVYAIDVGRYAWMRAGYDWANTDGFPEIANLLGQGNPAAESFRRSVIAGEVLEETPTPYELSKMLSRDQILSREFPNWDGIKPLRTRALAAAATAPREERLAKVRDAWKIWAREYPAAAEGYVVDPEAEAAWAALMGEDEGLVAAGPFDLDDFNVMTPEEWAAAFDVEAADIVGDVVVDAATGQALRPGLNVSDQIITDLIDRHIGRLQGLGPLVQASIRDALHLAVRNQLTLDDVIREIQATGPLGETAARAIARTELTAATNGGMLTGWKRDGFPFKEWKSLHDERVRHAHLEADGQVVPTEQEFEVGGFRAQYPGDPRLPVHLRINCRCYMDRIGEDGQTLNTRLVDSTRAQLYRLAQELNIPGRSKMRKDDLFQAIDRYRNGFGYTSLEEMNRAQLLIRARMAGIVGRSRMTKPELMIRLRALATGRNRDRWLIDAGHGTREQLAAVQAQLREDLRVLIEGPIPAIIAAGPPPTVEKIDIIRRKVFRRYGGADTGTAMCVGCGARLHWSNSTRWEQMTLIRLNSKHTWSSKNAMPVCLACAPKLAKMTTEKISTTFTIDSWETIAELFTPGWSKILGQFSTG